MNSFLQHVNVFQKLALEFSKFCSFVWLISQQQFVLQSVPSEQKVNALAASFVHSPVGENLDWKLSATISPCHVTVITEPLIEIEEVTVYVWYQYNF